jgi:hypothetical protein
MEAQHLLDEQEAQERQQPAIVTDEVSNFINSRVDPGTSSVEPNDGHTDNQDALDGHSQHSLPGLPLPRMVIRNLPFSQSLNEVAVQHNLGLKIFLLLRHDLFHVFLRMHTIKSLLMLLSIWTLLLIIFAGKVSARPA